MWTALKARLLELEGPEDWQAIRAARECFAALEVWLARSRRWGGAPSAPAARFRT
jgi:hypothetical protein